MARRSPVGWLAALILLVGVLGVVFVALPIRTCPTCRRLSKKLADPQTGTVSSRIGCPECGDRGSVTQLRYLKGSLVVPAVSRLLQCGRQDRQSDFATCLDQVAALSGRDPEEVSGAKFLGSKAGGAAAFLRAEEKDYVLVLLRGSSDKLRIDMESLLLLGMDGRVLDYFHCAGDRRWGMLRMYLEELPSPDGTVAQLTARRMIPGDDVNPPEEGKDFPVKVIFEGAGREFPAQIGVKDKTWTIRVKNGRFEILASNPGPP